MVHCAPALTCQCQKRIAQLGAEYRPDPKKPDTKKVKASEADNVFTKALGVVQESGPFACVLYLLSRSGAGDWSKAEQVVACHTLGALVEFPEGWSFADVQKVWKGISPLAPAVNVNKNAIINHALAISEVDLDRLLLIKQVWEQTLTYARYIARSMRGEGNA